MHTDMRRLTSNIHSQMQLCFRRNGSGKLQNATLADEVEG